MDPPSTPTKPKRHEYDTPRRARFFHTYFSRRKGTSLGSICRRKGIEIPVSTARSWIAKYEKEGSPSIRRTRRHSNRLGRKPALDVKQLEPILDPSHPSHQLQYKQMTQKEGFNVAPKTLQRSFKRYFNAQRYKKPYSKAISPKNKTLRIQYGKEHKDKTIRGF